MLIYREFVLKERPADLKKTIIIIAKSSCFFTWKAITDLGQSIITGKYRNSIDSVKHSMSD